MKPRRRLADPPTLANVPHATLTSDSTPSDNAAKVPPRRDQQQQERQQSSCAVMVCPTRPSPRGSPDGYMLPFWRHVEVVRYTTLDTHGATFRSCSACDIQLSRISARIPCPLTHAI